MQEGLQAVHLLDNNKKGKANFFLLEDVNRFTSSQQHQPENTIKALDVIEVDEKYRGLAEYLLSNVYIADDEAALQNSNGAIVLEKHGKFVKGKFTLGGGSVGLFEGKKIGRAKNLSKLAEEIAAQETVVNGLKAGMQDKQSLVIGFNQQLKENVIRQVQQDINNLTNQVFALQNKIENLNATQATSQKRLEDLEGNLESNQDSIC